MKKEGEYLPKPGARVKLKNGAGSWISNFCRSLAKKCEI
jgi:hypothetical protein